jgi:hypothetical protein
MLVLIPRSKVRLEVRVAQVFYRFAAFYGTRRLTHCCSLLSQLNPANVFLCCHRYISVAYAKLRKATISLIKSVHPRFHLDEF